MADDDKQLADGTALTRRQIRDLIYQIILGDWRRAQQYDEAFGPENVTQSQTADEKLRAIGREAGRYLLELAKTDPDENIRFTAVEYLRKLPGTDVQDLLEDPTPAVTQAPRIPASQPEAEPTAEDAAMETVQAAFRHPPDASARAAIEADPAAYLPAMLRARPRLMDYRATADLDTFIENLSPEQVAGPLVDLLDAPDPAVQRQAVVYCGVFGVEAAVDKLLALLEKAAATDEEDEDFPPPATTANALYALGAIGDGRAYEAVRSFLAAPQPEVRRAALSALGRFGDLRAVDEVLPYLSTRDRALRSALVVSLGGLMEDERARGALAQLAGDPSKPTRTSAAAIISKNARAGGPSVDLLLELIASPDHDVQRAALEGLVDNPAVHSDERLRNALMSHIRNAPPTTLMTYVRAAAPLADETILGLLREIHAALPDARTYHTIRGELRQIIGTVERRLGA